MMYMLLIIVVCWGVLLIQKEEETQKFKDLASFKAQFPNILASRPFVPAKSNRPLTGDVLKHSLIRCAVNLADICLYWYAVYRGQ